ncbi:hypothetical protein HVE01_06060 [Vreelandella venusta]|nr:hypothetical protein HVE01_06060 [Halomonas venusta]
MGVGRCTTFMRGGDVYDLAPSMCRAAAEKATHSLQYAQTDTMLNIACLAVSRVY